MMRNGGNGLKYTVQALDRELDKSVTTREVSGISTFDNPDRATPLRWLAASKLIGPPL